MREILFRGKIMDSDEWVYGSLVYSPSEKQYYIVEHSDDELSYPVEEETIGQFTGKLDKNGKKIFEDDIVKYIIGIKGYKSTYNTHTSPVKFKDCEFYPFTSSDIIETEIISNIHDNPELLSEVEE